jgi:hypothetical protein
MMDFVFHQRGIPPLCNIMPYWCESRFIIVILLLLLNLHQNAGAGDSPSDRPQWGCATPPSAVRGHAEASPFEVSGEFLSSTHQAIEEIVSGHQDMNETLQARLEVRNGHYSFTLATVTSPWTEFPFLPLFRLQPTF